MHYGLGSSMHMEENCVLTPISGLHPHGVNYSG